MSTTSVKRIKTAVVLILLALACWALFGQEPPLPPGAAPAKVLKLSWVRNPAADYFHSRDTNGLPVPIVYYVRMSTNVAAPHSQWAVLTATTNTTAAVSNLPAANLFFTVTASNFFLESAPSEPVAVPFDPPTDLHLIAE